MLSSAAHRPWLQQTPPLLSPGLRKALPVRSLLQNFYTLLARQREMSVMSDCQGVHGWYIARMSCISISICTSVTCTSLHEKLGCHALVLATC